MTAMCWHLHATNLGVITVLSSSASRLKLRRNGMKGVLNMLIHDAFSGVLILHDILAIAAVV
jgi:hypothetical protein